MFVLLILNNIIKCTHSIKYIYMFPLTECVFIFFICLIWNILLCMFNYKIYLWDLFSITSCKHVTMATEQHLSAIWNFVLFHPLGIHFIIQQFGKSISFSFKVTVCWNIYILNFIVFPKQFSTVSQVHETIQQEKGSNPSAITSHATIKQAQLW